MQKTLNKLFSLVNIASLVFQLVAPLVTLAPLPAFATTTETKLSWDNSKNSFHFSVNSNQTVDYLLAYRTPDKTEAITGSGKDDGGNFSRDLYAGTCSSGVCLPHQVLRGILKTKIGGTVNAQLFAINNGNLDIVKSGTDKDLNLSDEETAWLENPTPENLGKVNLVAVDSLPAPPPATPSATVATPSAEIPVSQPTPQASSSSQATVAGTQTESTEHGSLSATILKNTAAPSLSLDLSSPVTAGSATVTTNKPDYSPTDTVIVTGTNFIPNNDYTLEISSTDPLAVDFKTTVKTNSSGSFVYAYQLDGNYRPNYTVYVKEGTVIVAATTFTDTPASGCQNDSAGANDAVNQKDLTRMCVNYSGLPVSETVNWNWDDTGFSGGSTGDACALYDTDGDGKANYALCVGVSGNPAAWSYTKLYQCSDNSGQKCTSPKTEITSFTSSCSAGSSATDPFSTGSGYPNDTQANCTVNLSDLGGAGAANLVDVCSFESGSPGSNPEDCILFKANAGKLTVAKVLSPSSDSGLFNLQIDGTTQAANVGNGGTTPTQEASSTTTHTVGETAGTSTSLSDYTASVVCKNDHGTGSTVSITGTNPWTLNVADESDILCTITNTRNNGTLTANKVIVPSNDLGKFNLQIDGSTAGTGANVGNGGTTGAISQTSGSHTVGETAGTGTALSDYTAVISGDCAADGTVSVNPGNTKVCTITNTRKPRLTVIKVVTNDNGGTKQVSDFPLFVDGNSVTSGATNTFSIGSHVVSETGDASYTASFSGNCDANGNVTLAAGDNKTCTITNNDKAPSLHLRKTVTNDNGGTAVATAWTLTATGTGGSPTNLSGSTPVDSGSNFKTDTYALAESGGPSGYTAGTWNCVGGTMGDASHVTIVLGESATCTINNDDVAPTLKLVKTVTNNDGGSAVAGNWNLTATGTGGFTDAGDSTILHPVNANVQYTLSESGPSGYDPSSWSCDGGTQSTNHITLSVGQNVTCTITNNDQAAHLIVIKHIVNDNGGTASASDFTMTINGVSVSGGNSFAGAESPGTNKTLTSVGSYSVTESGPSGYTSSYSTDCTGTIALGETKTCTVTNNDIVPQLIVIKHVINDSGGTAVASDFTLDSGGINDTPDNFPGAENPGTTVTLNAGSYNVTETSPSGYSASYSADCSSSIAVGQTKTCTVTNDDISPTLTLQKIVVNDNGGTAIVSDFQAKIDGGNVPWAAAQTVNAGSHTASETVVSGYTASSWSGDCAANGTITLSLGQNATCTITNNDNAPSLTLVKQVLNDDGGQAVASAWTLTASGPTGFSGAGPSVSNGASFDAGTYDLSESGGPTGYSASAWVCTGGNQTNNDTVVVGLGDQVTCTIVNDDNAAHLIIIKHVINDNGGTAVASDFTLDSGGTNDTPDDFAGQEAPGTNVTLNAGSYLVTESGPSGYSASYSADCSGTIANGQTKTCTVTNDDIQPKLTVTKIVVNDNGGDKVVSDFPLFVDSTSVTSGQENGFNAGTYTVSETTQDGYSPSISGDCDSNGSVTLAVGDVKSCTITNNDIAPTLTVTKVLSPSNDPGLFDLQIDDTTYASDVTDGGTTGAIALSANTEYTVGESAGTGTNLSDYLSEISGDCDTEGLITLLPGEAKTCTITNTRKTGSVTFQKIVSGGTAVASDWGFTVQGVTGTFHDGDTLNLNTGTYLATESSQMSGYTPTSASGICGNLNGSTATLTVTENGGTCTFTNTRDIGTVIVHKKVDNGSGRYATGDTGANTLGFRWGLDSGDTNRLMGTDATITTGDKHSVTENGLAGYVFTGWYETNNEDFSCQNPESTTLPISFTVTKNNTRSFTLCNQLQNPVLTITKANDAVGDKAPGDAVMFTLTVTATQSGVNNVTVTDLPAGGFHYRSGTGMVSKNGGPASPATFAHAYASPGVWDLGNMNVGDVFTLTYIADIDGSEQAGLYTDLAWAQGKSLANADVLANAQNPGFVNENFVGTQVNIVKENQSTTTITGQVLGASTSLPATGGKTAWIILATLLLLSGMGLVYYGLKKNHA